MIHLSEKQERKLKNLERDPEAKVLGVFGNCPVVSHCGMTTGRSERYGRTVAVLRIDGRLAGMGVKQQRFFFRNKK